MRAEILNQWEQDGEIIVRTADGKVISAKTVDDYDRAENKKFLKAARPDLSEQEVEKIMDDFENTRDKEGPL